MYNKSLYKSVTSIVYLRNKDSGTVYVYTNTRETDPRTGKTRNVRKCIGHLDPETGEIVQNRGRNASRGYRTISVGPQMLLMNAADESGIRSVLQICFSERWMSILRAAGHIIHDRDPLSLMTDPEDPGPASPAVSLVSMIDPDGIDAFYRIWRKRFDCSKVRYLMMSSLHSYDAREWLLNPGRDERSFQSMSLGMCIDAASDTPVFLERMPLRPERDSDLATADQRMSWIGYRDITFVTEAGLSEEATLNDMLSNGRDFIVRLPRDHPLHSEAVAETREMLMDYRNYDRGREQHFSKTISRTYGGRRVYLHVYYSTEAAEREMGSFLELMDTCREELLHDRWVDSHRWLYERYFIVTEEDGVPKVEHNSGAIMHQNEGAGFIVLASHGVKDATEATDVYRKLKWAEERFDNLKNITDQMELKLYLSHRLNARLLLQFVAMVLVNHIHSRLQSSGLSKDMTAEEAIRSMEGLEAIIQPNGSVSFTDPGPQATKVIQAFGIDVRSEAKKVMGKRII